MIRMVRYKNIALLLTYVIGLLPKMFYNSGVEMWLSICKVRPNKTPLEFVFLYYGWTINFLILAYCLHYPKGLDKRVTRLILTITSLDLLHLLFLAKQGYGVEKIFLAILIVVSYDLYKKRYATH